jgi:rhodanese-related sulfurtransferase
MTTLDFLVRESATEYREKAGQFLTSHQLADFRRCPLVYWHKKQGLVPNEDRPAYLVGRAAHVLILEGRERFDAEYAVGGPINARTGKPFGANTQTYADWAAAQGKPVITEEQFSLVVNLTTGVRSHAIAAELLSDGVPEGVVRTEYCDRPCQARFDFFNPEREVIDLKTCDDLTWFEADARRFGYAHQFAFYHALVFASRGG